MKIIATGKSARELTVFIDWTEREAGETQNGTQPSSEAAYARQQSHFKGNTRNKKQMNFIMEWYTAIINILKVQPEKSVQLFW